MSRNDGRMGLPDNLVFDHDPNETPSAPAPNYTAEDNLAWTIPTEFVSLPSKGLFYPEGHPLHKVESVEIKYMTAQEEDMLTSESLIKKGVAIDRVLKSVLVDKSIPLGDLLVADKNALVAGTRITGYGPEYETTVTCPSCKAEVEHEFNLDISDYEDSDPLAPLRELGLQLTDNKTIVIELPLSKRMVECRLLTGRDQEKIGVVKVRKTKGATIETNTTDMLKRLVVAVDGDEDRFAVTAFVKTMPARDSKYLRSVVDKISPVHRFESEFQCESCGMTADVEVPLSIRFFWPNAKI